MKTNRIALYKQSAILLVLLTTCFVSNQTKAQIKKVTTQHNAPNLIIITTDGFRWQEMFNGMDTSISNQSKFNHGDSLYIVNKYGGVNAEDRQQKLMPFLFANNHAKSIRINGNRYVNNKVDVENPHWFSYPGYSELLTGYVDPAINSNNYMSNPHSNLLAYINKQKAYQGKVIAFGAWDAFNRILNEKVSGFPVINAFESVTQVLHDPASKKMSELLADSYKPFKEVECLDVFTHYQAMHYLKTKQPKAMFISYGETDEWAHHGNYSNYLDAAHQVDQWIADIWNWAQATPGYKDNTYILVTTDHGRGFGNEWTSHGADVKGASSTWFAIIGPNTVSSKNLFNSNNNNGQLYQKQLAATMSKLIGLPYSAEHPIGDAIY